MRKSHLKEIVIGILVSAFCILEFIPPVDAASGDITTVAGGGVGDDNEGTRANLRSPWKVVLDGLGNIYIADTDNHRIRKVDQSGIITTVAGDGQKLPFEFLFGAAVGWYKGDVGPATDASLSFPSDVLTVTP